MTKNFPFDKTITTFFPRAMNEAKRITLQITAKHKKKKGPNDESWAIHTVAKVKKSVLSNYSKDSVIGRALRVCTANFGHLGQDAAFLLPLHPNHRHVLLTCDAASHNPIFLFWLSEGHSVTPSFPCVVIT